MQMSAKGEYAFRAILDLSLRYEEQEPVRIEDIARAQHIPMKYLFQILIQLKRAELVRSRRGAAGGYFLARSPAKITLGDVLRVVEGPFLTLKCFANGRGAGCSMKSECNILPIWQELSKAVDKIMDGITFQEICRRVSSPPAMYHI